MKEFWNKPEGWEYILPILFGICLNVFIMLFFTGRLEDILIKCLEYLEALKWKIKRKMKSKHSINSPFHSKNVILLL